MALAALEVVLLAIAPRSPEWARPPMIGHDYPGAAPCHTTLQACINGATEGDVIFIAAGTYITGVTLDKPVSLIGADSCTTMIKALTNQRVLTVTGATITNSTLISGLTFADGRVTGGIICPTYCGGAILITGTARPLIQNVVVTNSAAGAFGGGIYADMGSPLTLINVNVLSNSAGSGGGLYAFGAIRLSGGRLENNSADGSGGGLYAFRLDASGTQFIRNRSGSDGGALAVSGALALSNTLFIGNQAAFGGGGAKGAAGEGRLVNVLFARNVASSGTGAALYLDTDDRVQILHTTIAGPMSSRMSAIYVATGTVGITNTILVSHSIGISNVTGTVYENYNLFFGNGINKSGTISGGGKDVSGKPDFVDPDSGDYHLGAASAAIDAGIDVGVPIDFEGDRRPQGGGFDIGYDEFTVSKRYLPLVSR